MAKTRRRWLVRSAASAARWAEMSRAILEAPTIFPAWSRIG
jgi:hypothetical protein